MNDVCLVALFVCAKMLSMQGQNIELQQEIPAGGDKRSAGFDPNKLLIIHCSLIITSSPVWF
jgi:hypothetical protein